MKCSVNIDAKSLVFAQLLLSRDKCAFFNRYLVIAALLASTLGCAKKGPPECDNERVSEALIWLVNKHTSDEVEGYTQDVDSYAWRYYGVPLLTTEQANRVLGSMQHEVSDIKTTAAYGSFEHSGNRRYDCSAVVTSTALHALSGRAMIFERTIKYEVATGVGVTAKSEFQDRAALFSSIYTQ